MGGSPCNRRALQLLVPNVTFLSKSADEKKVKQVPVDFNVKTKYLRAIKASAKTAGDKQAASFFNVEVDFLKYSNIVQSTTPYI